MNIIMGGVRTRDTKATWEFFPANYLCPVSRAPDLEMMRIFSPLTLVR